MRSARPRTLIWGGFACLAVGWMVLLLMVVRVIPLSFALSLFGYALTLAGLFAGLLGVFSLRSRGE